MLFQLMQIEVAEDGRVVATTRTLPLFEVRQDAMAMAAFAAARSGDDYDYDADNDCWWSVDARGRRTNFIVWPILSSDYDVAA
jgi:hypothetical protein